MFYSTYKINQISTGNVEETYLFTFSDGIFYWFIDVTLFNIGFCLLTNGTGDTNMVSQVEPFTCYC